jgi:hypothetical protein
MPTGKRRMQPEEGDEPPKRVMAPGIDATCNTYIEGISPAFDPDRVLLRRLSFIGPDKKVYIDRFLP